MHESSVHECLKSSLAFRKPGMTAVSGRMARAAMASRSASMTVKAQSHAALETAHTEPRGALWSIGCQPSAAESCSPTATHDTSTLSGPPGRSGDLRLLIAALSGWY